MFTRSRSLHAYGLIAVPDFYKPFILDQSPIYSEAVFWRSIEKPQLEPDIELRMHR